MDPLASVRQTIERDGLISRGSRVVIACSGGGDSVALAAMLRELAPLWSANLLIAHVHHGLRGEHADRDAALVRQLARNWGIDYRGCRVDPRTRQARAGGNLMAIARDLRYAALFAIAEEADAQLVATGHTADDRAETLLLNLARGAGPRGLAALRAKRADGVIRPLIDTRRSTLRHWLRDRAIPWREDASNQDRNYRRVRVRKELTPWLEEHLNPRVVENLARTARILDELEQAAAHGAALLYRQALLPSLPWQKRLSRTALAHHPISMQAMVVRLAVEALTGDCSGTLLGRIGTALRRDESRELSARVKLVSSANALTVVDRNFRVDAIPQTPLSTKTPLEIHGWRFSLGWRRPQGVRNRWVLEAGGIHPPVSVRSRLPGDRFQPAGGAGTRKIGRYMIDKNIPSEIRAGIPLVVDRKGIVWVVGFASDRRVSRPLAHERVLCIHVTPPKWYPEPEILP